MSHSCPHVLLHVSDSGYPGSPSSGLASYQSQVWPGPGQEMGQSIDLARRELAGLIRDQGSLAGGQPGPASLPSFPDIFSPGQGLLGPVNTEDLDDLDKEISQIVEAATCRIPAHVEAEVRHVTDKDTCHRPRPIRTSTILLSPSGEVTGVAEASLATQSGGRLSVLSSVEAGRDSPDQVMVAVVSTATHAFNQGKKSSPVWTSVTLIISRYRGEEGRRIKLLQHQYN